MFFIQEYLPVKIKFILSLLNFNRYSLTLVKIPNSLTHKDEYRVFTFIITFTKLWSLLITLNSIQGNKSQPFRVFRIVNGELKLKTSLRSKDVCDLQKYFILKK